MTTQKIIGTIIGILVFALIDYKAWLDSPADADGKKQPFNVFVALPRWVVGALAGGEVGGGAE